MTVGLVDPDGLDLSPQGATAGRAGKEGRKEGRKTASWPRCPGPIARLSAGAAWCVWCVWRVQRAYRCPERSEAEHHWCARDVTGDQRRQRCGEVTGREQVGSVVSGDICVPPPSHPVDVLGREFVIRQRAAGSKAHGADEEVVVDHPVVAARMAGSGGLLVPDVRRVGVKDKPRLLVQLPAQRRQRQFTGLDAAARSRPYDRCGRRYSWMREAEAAQQDTVVIGQDDPRTARLSLVVAGVWFTYR